MNPFDAAITSSWTDQQLFLETTPGLTSPVSVAIYSPMASSSSVSSNCPTPTYPDPTDLSVDQLKALIRRKTESIDTKKPAVSYICLIAMAIDESEEKMLSLAGIYHWITTHFPYYENEKARWQNSVRHCLSFNDCFVPVKRPTDAPGKGNLWKIHDDCKNMVNQQNLMRREKRFRAEGGKIRKRDLPRRKKETPVKKTIKKEMFLQETEEAAKKIMEKIDEKRQEKEELQLKPVSLDVKKEEVDEEVEEEDDGEDEGEEEDVKTIVAPTPRIPLPSISIASSISHTTYGTAQQPQYSTYMTYQPTYSFIPTTTDKAYTGDLYGGTLYQPINYNYPGSWNDINRL